MPTSSQTAYIFLLISYADPLAETGTISTRLNANFKPDRDELETLEPTSSLKPTGAGKIPIPTLWPVTYSPTKQPTTDAIDFTSEPAPLYMR